MYVCVYVCVCVCAYIYLSIYLSIRLSIYSMLYVFTNGVHRFNMKPKRGLEHLKRHGFVTDDVLQMAEFFKNLDIGVDKTALGDFLGENKPLNTSVLKALIESMICVCIYIYIYIYIYVYMITHCSVTPYLSSYTTSYYSVFQRRPKGPHREPGFLHHRAGRRAARLPHALQAAGRGAEDRPHDGGVCARSVNYDDYCYQITLIVHYKLYLYCYCYVSASTEEFAQKYCRDNPGKFSNSDTAFVLAFSLIMLQTDIHNPNVKNKMSKDQFVSTNRGIDDGKNLPREYLEMLYDSLLKNPITLAEDEEARSAFCTLGECEKGVCVRGVLTFCAQIQIR